MNLTYSKERPLFIILLTLSLIFWIGVIAVTFGVILIWVLMFFIFYLFIQSGFIAYLKGTAVQISENQYPEVYQMHLQCCQKLGIETPPEIYLLNGDGILNALATRFLGRNFVVLFASVVDALQRHPESLKFYIGHELGHIKQKHLLWGPVIFPAAILPIIGAAHSRAEESTCDLHGLACCDNPKDALAGVAVLAAGQEVWNKLNVNNYAEQSNLTGSFWMSFHELISDYPWLVKRMARIVAEVKHEEASLPRRSPFAYLFALFVPRLGVGGGGAGSLVSVMIVVAIIGILAAIAIPAYQGYIAKAQVSQSMMITNDARVKMEKYIIENNGLPETLEQTGYQMPENNAVSGMNLNNEGSIVVEYAKAPLKGQTLIFRPYLDNNNQIQWECSGGSLAANYRPVECPAN